MMLDGDTIGSTTLTTRPSGHLQVDLDCLKQAYRDAKAAYKIQQENHAIAIARGECGCQSAVDRMESAYHRAARKLADAVCEVKT